MIETGTLIVGGGLSGLHSAWRLAGRGADFVLLEGRDRLGGRILSATAKSVPEAAYDLGPTWFWPGQPRVPRLARELGLEVFLQPAEGAVMDEDPTGEVSEIAGTRIMPDSFRLAGGLGGLVTGLGALVPQDRIHLGARVTRIAQTASGVEASALAAGGRHVTVKAARVVLALPPRLAAEWIDFVPSLPTPVRETLAAIPTWMAGHAKVVALYDRPFWREAGLSGDAISRRGPLVEIHDASPFEGSPYALFGFVGIPAARRAGREPDLLEAVAAQLARLFGAEAGTPVQLLIKDWARDPLTAVAADQEPLAHHPTYGLPSSLECLLDGRLIFASSETAREHGGLVEGALEASEAALATRIQV